MVSTGKSGGGEGPHQRRQVASERAAFRLEKGGNEEGVACEFHGAHFTGCVVRDRVHCAVPELGPKGGVQAVAAVITFLDLGFTVGVGGKASGGKRQCLADRNYVEGLRCQCI